MNDGPLTQVERAGVTLVAEQHGPPGAPGVLLSHGVASSSWFIEECLVPPLVSAGHRVELMGLPGHDPSSPCRDAARHAIDEVAADMAAMAAATNCDTLGGVSLAGHAATRLAAVGEQLARTGIAAPKIRAVIACLPAWVGQAPVGIGVHAHIADQVRELGTQAMLEQLRGDRSIAPWLQHTLPRDWARHDPQSIAAALLSLDGGEAPTAEQLSGLDVPVAIVTWPDDPGHPIEAAHAWHRLLPRSALRETSIQDMQGDRTLFGQLALDALAELGVR